MTTELSQTNQQINSIIPCNYKTTHFLLLALANKGEQIRRYGSGGSVVENLNKSDFSEIKIIKPQLDILKNFNERINPLFSNIKCLQNQNSSLSLITGNLLNSLIQ